MSRTLTLEISEDVEEVLRLESEKAGQTLEEWASSRLRSAVGTARDRREALARLRQYAGIIAPQSPSSGAGPT